MTQVFETAGRFAAKTPFNKDFVAAVKELPGRRWDADAKVWTVGADQEAALRDLCVQFFGTDDEERDYNAAKAAVLAATGYVVVFEGLDLSSKKMVYKTLGVMRSKDEPNGFAVPKGMVGDLYAIPCTEGCYRALAADVERPFFRSRYVNDLAMTRAEFEAVAGEPLGAAA